MRRLPLTHVDRDRLGELTRDRIGLSTLERYTGSAASEFQRYVLLTNFARYLDTFAERFKASVRVGSVMRACHASKQKMSIINMGVGSPTAALIVDLLSFIRPFGVLLLGMCGGLRKSYAVGDFFNPVAAIRDEKTSEFYLPPRCPALSSFSMQRYVCEELEQRRLKYHTGVVHTTNVRFWEFDRAFRARLHDERAQAIDMECATLFAVGYARRVAVGALMLISDLPFARGGIKTKESARSVFERFTYLHIDAGLAIMERLRQAKVNAFGHTRDEATAASASSSASRARARRRRTRGSPEGAPTKAAQR